MDDKLAKQNREENLRREAYDMALRTERQGVIINGKPPKIDYIAQAKKIYKFIKTGK